MELYLGANMSNHRMHLFVFWDSNVYEERLVKEWLDEVRNATEWYLGREEAVHVTETEKARL